MSEQLLHLPLLVEVTDPVRDYMLVKLVGLIVGWLFITYGILLWSLGDTPLPVMTRTSGQDGGDDGEEAVGVAYPFAFTAAGAGFMLMANSVVIPGPMGSAILEALGYLCLAVVGTAIFVFRLLYIRQTAAAQ